MENFEINNNSDIDYKEDEHHFFIAEMANLHPKHTGLSTILLAKYNGRHDPKDHPNSPHVHVVIPNCSKYGVPISIAEESEVLLKLHKIGRLQKEDDKALKAATLYVGQNWKPFLLHWDGELSDFELQQQLFEQTKRPSRFNND